MGAAHAAVRPYARAIVRRLALVPLTALATVASACGSSSGDAPSNQAKAPAGAEAADRRDIDIDRANEQLARAAGAEDRAGVLRAQRELDELARTSPGLGGSSPRSADPYQRAFDDFSFKRGPLYVQQLITGGDDHRAFVAVIKDHFCLLTTAARRQAADAVYQPLDRRLRDAGIDDFAFIVIPLTQTAPATSAAALAVGRRGKLRLTARGRTC